MLISCKPSSSFISLNDESNSLGNNWSVSKPEYVIQKVQFINSYISKIDFKSGDTDIVNSDMLIINGNQRIITTDEFKKDILLKNNAIVRVKYKNHLYNNFIKSKIFYYNNNELVCIKIHKITPNNLSEATLYQRTIYVHNQKAISDTDNSDLTDTSNELVALGQENLKNEYLLLN